jgi:hypothetical protein
MPAVVQHPARTHKGRARLVANCRGSTWREAPPPRQSRLAALRGACRSGYKRGMEDTPDIVIVADGRIEAAQLRQLVGAYFDEMVKYVIDIERGVVAVGGEMHADAEHVLLANGSRQADLWGANYWPGRGEEGCIEFTSLINIRPAQDNRGMEIQSEALRARVREWTFARIGRGEALP